ncbi:YncE family protein [Gottfriedia acidiceleris]|uniref:YncE family protein n=1 Tax=Gottfriedia acidiceleris TaxID=371036 RepID=UPI003D1D6E18
MLRKIWIVLLIFSISLTFFPHTQAAAATNVNQLSIGSSLTKWVLDDPSKKLYAISSEDKKLFFINSSSLTIDKTLTLGGAPTDIIKSDGNLYVAIDSLKQIIVVDLSKKVITQTLKTTSDPYQIVKDGDMIYYTEENVWSSIYAYNLQTNLDQIIQSYLREPALAINTENHILYIGEADPMSSHLIYYSTKDNKVIGTSNYNNGYGFRNLNRNILFDGVNVYYAGRDFNPNNPNRFNGNFGNDDNVIYVNNNLVFTYKSIYNKDSHEKLGEYGYNSDLIASSQNSIFIYSSELSQIKRYDSNQINSSNIISLISGIRNQSQSTALSRQINDKTRQLKIQSNLTKWVLDEPTQTLYGISTDDKTLLFINSQTLNLEKVINFACNPTDIIKDNGKLYVALDDANQIAVIDMASRTKVDTLYTTSDPYLIAKDGDMIYYAERDQWCDVFAYNLQTNIDQILPIEKQYEPTLSFNTDKHILYIGESGLSDSNLIYYSTTDNKVIGTSNWFPSPRRSILFNGINVYYAGFAFSSEDVNKMNNSENLFYANQNFLFSSTSVYDEGSNAKLGDFKNKVDLIESNSNSLYTYNQAVDVVEKYSNNSEQLSNSNIGTIVSAIPHDTDNTKGTATPLNLTTINDEYYQYGATGIGKFENEKDVDYFRITLDAAGMIETDLSQLKNAGIVIDLFNSKDELLESLVTDRGNQVIPILDQGLPAGTYYIRLSIDNGTIANANYRMLVFYRKSNFVEKEANNTLKTANPMTIGKEYIGFSDFDTKDYYKIETKENGKLTVRGSYSPNVTLYYILINTKGEQVDGWKLDPKDTDETKNLFTVGVRAGTYYLVVSQDDDTYSNEYYATQVNFKADPFTELEHNETTGSATTVLLKRTYNGFISWKNDIDTFKVNVPANANVSFSLSQASSTSFKVEVVNNNNRLIKTFNTKTGKSPMISLGNLNLVKGTYFIKVKYLSGKSDEVSYKLQLQPKIYWGKVEYKPGIVGKVVAVSTSKVYKLKSGKLIYVKSAPKGSEFAVYGSDKYGYKLGNGYYVKKNKTVKYYTVPSQVKSNYVAVNK